MPVRMITLKMKAEKIWNLTMYKRTHSLLIPASFPPHYLEEEGEDLEDEDRNRIDREASKEHRQS